MWSTCDCGFDFFYFNSVVCSFFFFYHSLRSSNWYCTLKCHFVTNTTKRQLNGAKTIETRIKEIECAGERAQKKKQQKQHRTKWNVYMHGKIEQEKVKKCSNTKVWNVMLFRYLRRGLKSQRKLVYMSFHDFCSCWTLNAELNAQHSFMFHAIGFNAQIDINICDIWDKMFTLSCTHVIQAIQDEKQKMKRIFASLQAMTFLNSSTSAKTMNEYQTWRKNHRNYALHDPNPVWMLCFVNI